MLDPGSPSNDGIVRSEQAGHLEEHGDWELVLRETHHRVKNTLTLLGASVRREFAKRGPNEVAAALDRFERRVFAFGRLYQLLSGDSDLETISAASYFETLCRALSEAILEPAGIRCEVAIERGALPARLRHRLGLIIAELVTNAAKHAFIGMNGGLIRVEAFYRDGCWCCTVADNGIGAKGPLQGTGARILQALARSIRAQLGGETGRCGTIVTIVVPVLA